MAFNIYENDLEKGFCEIHPYVQQEYPCTICISENTERLQKKQDNKPRKGL